MATESQKPEERQVSSATIDLSGEHLGLANEADPKVGGKMRIVIYGTVREVIKAAGDPMDEGGGGSARLTLDVNTLKIASNNEIAELFDEEFDA